ncbi:hypothetical protein ACWD04_13965 [Streptomyces sp. NPDC002911]
MPLSPSFTAAASILPPVLLYALFRPRFDARGARWTVYGTIPLIAALMVPSPAFSGTPVALFPEWDFVDVFLGLQAPRRDPEAAPDERHRHRARRVPVRARGGA